MIPCGVGNTDNGFLILGIKKTLLCNHPSANIYALVYNYFIRSTRISDKDIPRYIQEMDSPYELDYRSIFRMAMIVLELIHHNVVSDNLLKVTVREKEACESLNAAVGMINHYAALFCRLSHLTAEPLKVQFVKNGILLSLDSKEGIHVVNATGSPSIARELWFGQKINYKLNNSNRADLEYLLGEISPFDSFKEGQLDALYNMMAARGHAVCIMPTGSGKSLIYYLASLLQPLPMIVVAPTEILIEDQIRNLWKIHRIDNAAHWLLKKDNSFKGYELCTSLNYVTPMTLRNRNLHVQFRYMNNGSKLIGSKEERIAPGPLLSYIVLDEIHCLSNWSHDFRPEYLMLSGFLRRFMDRVSFWGFTATANYTVVEDVQNQLSIPLENFFSPISFDKFNVTYKYESFHTSEEMYAALASIISELISKGQRTLIFTKTDEISKHIADIVGYEADIFSADMPDAYHHFADEKCKVLIACEQLGIGINLPNVRNIIHFGLPLSKSEYVQEIGRAGRSNEEVTSFVLYLQNEVQNAPELLLRRDTRMAELLPVLKSLKNDYGDIYRRLTNNCPSQEALSEQLIELYKLYDKEVQPEALRYFAFEDLEENKRLLYMLFVTGYLRDWYTYGVSKNNHGVDIMLDINSIGWAEYQSDPRKMLRRMQEKLRDYFDQMGNNREEIAKINRVSSIEEILNVYVEWYYQKYLYQHNEMFLDLFDLIDGHKGCPNREITILIKDFFVLPFIKLKSDEAHYSEMTLKEITNKVITGLDIESLSNIERINSNRYSYKMDYLLFSGFLRYYDRFEGSRLDRILDKVPVAEQTDILSGMIKLYGVTKPRGKLQMLKYINQRKSRLHTDQERFLRNVYDDGEKDIIYYGIMAQRMNQKMDFVRR